MYIPCVTVSPSSSMASPKSFGGYGCLLLRLPGIPGGTSMFFAVFHKKLPCVSPAATSLCEEVGIK